MSPSDGWHQHVEVMMSKASPNGYPFIANVHAAHLATPLEFIVFWWGLMAAGSAIAWSVLRCRVTP